MSTPQQQEASDASDAAITGLSSNVNHFLDLQQQEASDAPAEATTRRPSNANYLLNFHSTPPPSHRPHRHIPRRASSSRSIRQPYNRLKFLQANYRFLISDQVLDIKKYEADPDLMLDWDDVIKVEYLTTTPIICPITLDTPFCPQITPCGHIFSFESIIAHLQTQGGPELRSTCASCPLCGTTVVARELRPVNIINADVHEVGDTITLCMLWRYPESIIPSSTISMQHTTTNTHSGTHTKHTRHLHVCNLYSKFSIVADPLPVWTADMQLLAHRAVELSEHNGMDSSHEIPHVLSAMTALTERAKAWSERRQAQYIERMQWQIGAPDAVLELPLAVETANVSNFKRSSSASTLQLQEDQHQQGGLPISSHADTKDATMGVFKSPEEIGREMMQLVKEAGEKATHAAHAVFRDARRAKALEKDFPSLSLNPVHEIRKAREAHDVDCQNNIAGEDTGRHTSTMTMSTAHSMAHSTGTALSSHPNFPVHIFYQSMDGQWMFLCPLNTKMLLEYYASSNNHHHDDDNAKASSSSSLVSEIPGQPPSPVGLPSTGSSTPLSTACRMPAIITAPLLEIEKIEQTESSRKRNKALGHLPLSGSYSLCEVDLSGILPSEAIAPFEEELLQRRKRRVQQAQRDARESRKEAAAMRAAAAAANQAIFSAEDLAAMPLPSASRLHEGTALDDSGSVDLQRVPDPERLHDVPAIIQNGAVDIPARSLQDHERRSASGSSPPSFAIIAKLGYSATGPTLSESMGGGISGGSSPPTTLPLPVRGAWGARAHNSSAHSVRSVPPSMPWSSSPPISSRAIRDSSHEAGKDGGGKKGGSGKKKVLLMTTQQRRY